MLTIKNARVFGTDETFRPGTIRIQNGVFADDSTEAVTEESAGEELDASGCYAIPGLVDIHFHGALGMDVCDGSREAFERIAAYEASCGITAICPATLTLPVPDLEQVLATGAAFAREQEAARQGMAGENTQRKSALSKTSCEAAGQNLGYDAAVKLRRGADLVGFNMEGPFISYAKRGAQNPEYILPCSAEIADRFLTASDGLVKIIGLAPEVNPDFEAYIREVSPRVMVSLAHTDTDYDTACRALSAGACHLVHLYDAMRDLTHRDPGPIGAAMDAIWQRRSAADADVPAADPSCFEKSSSDETKRDITCEIICDGIHVHPSAVRAAFTMMGKEHMILISDSLRSTGMPDGEYDLGGQAVVKKEKFCRLREEGNIAGSVSNLMDCLRTAVMEMGLPLETAVASATILPARRIGVQKRYGSIEKGKRGNVVLLDEKDLRVRTVIKDGEVLR